MAKGIGVRFYGDWDGSGVKKAEQDINAFSQQVSGFTGSMTKSFLGVGAAIGGAFAITSVISGVTRFLQESAAAAMEDEKSLVALAIAMENVGVAAENAKVEDFVLQLSLATGVADDQLRPAFQRLVTVTGDVATSQSALQLAMDISAGTGRDLDSVTTALAKAYGGQTTALGRLGVGLDQATLKSKDMDAITAALSDKFSGQAAAAAETFQGKMQRLDVAINEAKETIGYELIIALDNASQALGGPGGFSGLLDSTADKAANFVAGVGVVITELANLRFELVQQDSPADAFLNFLIEATNRLGGIAFPIKGAVDLLLNLGDASRESRGGLSATTSAAIAAGKAMGQQLAPATYEAADAARTATRSYVDLWESIWNANRVARDFANTSGTVTSAIAEGTKLGASGYWRELTIEYGNAAKGARDAASAFREANDAASRRPSGRPSAAPADEGPTPAPAATAPVSIPPAPAPPPGNFFGGIVIPGVAATIPAPSSGNWFGGIRLFADGGIVTRPTMGLVGESGPEAIIPLSQYDRGGGGQTINLTVNAGMGTDGAEVGRQIVDALKQYERRNGPVPITVA